MSIKKHLKKKLHPNRNFIWAISLCVILGLALFGYILVSTEKQNADSVFTDLQQKKVFADSQAGFEVSYPANWQLEKDQQGNVVFDNPQNSNESLTVVSANLSSEKTLRAHIPNYGETDYVKNGLNVAIIKVEKANSNSSAAAAIIKNSKKLFYIFGSSQMVTQFVNNFKITK